MEWTGSMKAVFCLVAFLHLSCNYQWMVNADTCVAQTLVITADNKMRLFIDGTEVTGLQHANSPGIADTVTLPCLPCVIAVSAENNGKNNGVLGSMIPSHFVTDASWKCICQNNVTEGWQAVDFDDSLWPAANEIHAHGVKPWQAVVNVQPDALWITCSSGSEKAKYLFCRRRIGCDVPTTASTPGPTEAPTPPGAPVPQSCRGASGETGPSCITSCGDLANGDYQSCKGCQVYATCSNGILYDSRNCPSGGYWDDKVKRCEVKSTTCQECQ